MNNHRYILEKYKGPASRYTCPQCNAKRRFTRYIDTETNNHIASNVGRCDRQDNCTYHYPPKKYFEDNQWLHNSDNHKFKHRTQDTNTKGMCLVSAPQPSFIDTQTLNQSLKCYHANNFVTYLTAVFGKEVTAQLISRYYIGTTKHYPGATVFWQVDINRQVRTGKIMLYSPITGKRNKDARNAITWVHSALNLPQFTLNQCLFGEHLLIDKTKPVALVESEKTAIIASAYKPQYIWLATGGIGGLTQAKCQLLKGRQIALYPDLNAYHTWAAKAKQINLKVTLIDDTLEKIATPEERKQGLDIADYFLRNGE